MSYTANRFNIKCTIKQKRFSRYQVNIRMSVLDMEISDGDGRVVKRFITYHSLAWSMERPGNG
jgi:hypothetical protein